jgi:hypothetical protein
VRLRWRIPLPGPISIGGSIPLTDGSRRSRGGGAGCVTAPLLLLWWCLVLEGWLCWWLLKPFYILGVLTHRRTTGRPTPIWRSRNGWW